MVRVLARRLVQSLVEAGPKGVWLAVRRRIKQRSRRNTADSGSTSTASEVEQDGTDGVHPDVIHPFDAEFGTDTGGLVFGEALHTGHWNDLWNTAYYGISPSGFNQMMAALGDELGGAWGQFTFVDLGSGKGRALLLGSRFGFRRMVGVEIAAELSSVAAENVRVFAAEWQVCRDIEVMCEDAAKFEYPAGPLVVYLYNPFLPPVLKRCLKNLVRSLKAEPREVYVVYGNPMGRRLMERWPQLVKLWERSFDLSSQDLKADRVGAKREDVTVWRYRPQS